MRDDDFAALGDQALRLARPPGSSAAGLVRALRADTRVRDVVVSEAHVGVYFRDAAMAPDELRALLAGADALAAPRGRDVEIVARYDGEDLPDVAQALGLTPPEVVELHRAATYRVTMMGFLPGFAYLGPVDPRLRLPRRSRPRARVPAGALAIAGTYTAVYPFASPGGWHLIGHAPAFAPFDIRPEDVVRFVDPP